MSMSMRLQEIDQFLDRLGKDYPEETQAFFNFMQKAEAGPALDVKTKELINVGISVSAQCEWCIAFHARSAIEAGASKDEVMTAGFMAVLMHGGPALMYMMRLAEALQEFDGGEQKK
jgi:AhpD family alkylhydroperoxidase